MAILAYLFDVLGRSTLLLVLAEYIWMLEAGCFIAFRYTLLLDIVFPDIGGYFHFWLLGGFLDVRGGSFGRLLVTVLITVYSTVMTFFSSYTSTHCSSSSFNAAHVCAISAAFVRRSNGVTVGIGWRIFRPSRRFGWHALLLTFSRFVLWQDPLQSL